MVTIRSRTRSRAADRAPSTERAFVAYVVASLSLVPERELTARMELIATGVDPGVADAVRRRRYRELGPRDEAIAGFVHRLAVAPGSLELDDLFDLRAVGVADPEMLAIRSQVTWLTSPNAASVRAQSAVSPPAVAASA